MKVIIASNNQGKIREYKDILEPLGYEVLSRTEAGVEVEIEETGTTFMENARLKADAIYKIAKTAVLADDSGISIDFLNGDPGIRSARFMPELSQKEKNEFILNKMKDTDNRKAKFTTAICFIKEDGEKIEVQADVNGKIANSIRGDNGFGYDPIFIPDGYEKTYAELSESEKNKISHRGKATNLLKEKLMNL